MDAQADLTGALSEVRKAYRLIWLYQRRVVDIARFISDRLGYRFWRWKELCGRMPGQKTTNPFAEGNWIWATLPLYRMSLLYFPPELDKNVQKVGQWMLELVMETNTGAKVPEDGSEPSPMEFMPADQSETFMRLYAWYCTSDGSLNWYDDIWKELEWPKQDEEITPEVPNIPIRILRKSFDLSRVVTRATVERALVEFQEAITERLATATAAGSSEPNMTSIRLRG